MRRFVARPTNALALAVLALAVIAALWPTAWLPQDPMASDLLERLKPPAWMADGNGAHLLGTDNLGRDVFSRLVLGARYTLLIATAAIAISALIGIAAGVVSGYVGGSVDSVIMRLVDAQLAFPIIILLIAVVGVVGTGIPQLVIVLGVTGWAEYARIVRGSTLRIRATDYVEAARAVGARPWRLMARDVLPNLTSEIIVLTSFGLARLILTEAGLSFLGLGVQPPRPSWGGMVGDARDYLQIGWWILAFPGAAIALVVLAFNLLGDRLRDVLDPRARHAAPARKWRRAATPARAAEDAVTDAPAHEGLVVCGLVTELWTPRGTIRACNDVSFDVAPGEILGLVGESGSGKSMIANSITSLLPRGVGRIAEGEVRLGGRALTRLSARELRTIRGKQIGMVFQDPMTALNPVLTIGWQLAEGLTAHDRGLGRAGARARAVELLELVGIPDAAAALERYPHELSGGMRQRVVIALAIANRPRLLIADEPTTALDVTIQAQILDLLRVARDETGAAVILITHDLGVVAEAADRVAVMYAGRIVELATVDELFHEPRHPYTAGLLTSRPRLGDPRARLESIAGNPPLGTALPTGCAFHPRCALAGGRARCAEQTPVLAPEGAAHVSACHFQAELAGLGDHALRQEAG